jgi:hypothetical protein
LFKKLVQILAVPAVILGIGLPALAASAATPVTATAATHLTQRPDSGYSGNWALDNMQRTASVTLGDAVTPATDCGATATTCYAYTGTISDQGEAFATTGVTSPGAQAVAIKGSPVAAVQGSATVTFDASSDTPSAATVPASLAGAGSAEQSTTNWVEQFFPAGTDFSAPSLPTWSWVYNDSADCQTWTDAYDVTQANSGDITGVDQCVAPVAPTLSLGKAVSVSSHRENVQFTSSGAGELRFVITGPGAINGHVGWVQVHAGVNTAVYTGLLSGHGYTVRYTPYTAKYGIPIAGGKVGYVYFVTAK